jgi:hypothetical protein
MEFHAKNENAMSCSTNLLSGTLKGNIEATKHNGLHEDSIKEATVVSKVKCGNLSRIAH